MTETKASRTKKSGYKLFATELSGVVVGIALIILAYLVGQDRTVYPTTYIICISGYIPGQNNYFLHSFTSNSMKGQINTSKTSESVLRLARHCTK